VHGEGAECRVEGLSYSVYPGETVAIVGESGSGKTVSALSIMRLLPPGTARITRGSIRLDGRELFEGPALVPSVGRQGHSIYAALVAVHDVNVAGRFVSCLVSLTAMETVPTYRYS
jgi:ABC-type dipeptide/oligopeptide/nickel transport system ATPase component